MSTDALAKPLRRSRRGGFVRPLGARSEIGGRVDGAGRGSAVVRAASSRPLWLPDVSRPREGALAAPAQAEHLGRIPRVQLRPSRAPRTDPTFCDTWLSVRSASSMYLSAALVTLACSGTTNAAGPASVAQQSSVGESDRPPRSSERETSGPRAEPTSDTGPIESLPELRVFRVVVDEVRGERLGDALNAALAAAPGEAVPAGLTNDLAMVIRRPTGRCTYVWTLPARDRHVRWLRAVREERGLRFGLVAHWEGGATALELEGLDLVGECPGRQGVAMPATPPDPNGTMTARVGSTGLWVDVPRLYQPVANGARFSFELLRDPLPISIYRDPPEQGLFDRHARPATGVDIETRRLPSGARHLRRREGDVVTIYVLVEVDGERWLCSCDESLEAVCRSCRAAP